MSATVAPPSVDYSDTSRRPPWEELPPAIREAVGRLAGGPVVRAEPSVRSGFSGAYAGIVAGADGQRVFAKAGGPDQLHVVAALAEEARVLRQLPEGMPAPSLVGFDQVEGWSVLVLSLVPGRMPGQPWTPPEVRAVHDACVVMAELGAASSVGSRDYASRISDDPEIRAVGAAMAAGSFPSSPVLPAWLPRHQEEVGQLVLGASGQFDGDTVCHGDLRPDNLLVDDVRGTAVVVDWNWVGRAAAWVDWIGLLPLMAAQGIDTDDLLASSPLTQEADPEAIDAYLACIVAYMVAGFGQEVPPGCTPALRRHQLLMAHLFLDFLRERRGWAAGHPG
jgi:aminoglycoside phosphotransferase